MNWHTLAFLAWALTACNLDFESRPLSCGDLCGAVDTAGDADTRTMMDTGCAGGNCGSDCEAGELFCDGVCIDPTSNNAFCGASDCESATPCPSGTLCNGLGRCSGECAEGLTVCAEACVDTQAHNAHCGACDTLCLDQQLCVAGSCACRAGWEDCNGDPLDGCEVALDSRAACGSCDAVCAFDHDCIAGVCEREVTKVATGGRTACALLSTGHVYCWGANDRGQLGSSELPAESWSPVLVDAIDDAVDLTTGGFQTYSGASVLEMGHACVIRQGGEVWCWGDNRLNQLGDDTNVSFRQEPAAVPGLAGVTLLDAGGAHTCALNPEGLWCWGGNHSGQIGADPATGDRNNRVPLPLQILDASTAAGLVDLALGGNHSCGLWSSGEVRCWGSHQFDQQGPAASTVGCGQPCVLTPTAVSGLSERNIAVGAGLNSTCAIDTAGVVWCWGQNQDGQLGSVTTTESTATPVAVDLAAAALSVEMGDDFACARLSNNSTWCWGDNLTSDLGIGEVSPPPTPPTQQPGAPAAQLDVQDDYGCALGTDGEVRCWGRNEAGQVGSAPDVGCSGLNPCTFAPTVVTLP